MTPEQMAAMLRHAYEQLVAGCVSPAGFKSFADGLIAPVIRGLERMPPTLEFHDFKQPGWHHVAGAFVDGAREARGNPDADDALFIRAADGYTKRVHEEVDPETERRLRENDWDFGEKK